MGCDHHPARMLSGFQHPIRKALLGMHHLFQVAISISLHFVFIILEKPENMLDSYCESLYQGHHQILCYEIDTS